MTLVAEKGIHSWHSEHSHIFFKGRDQTKRTIVCYYHSSFFSLNVVLSVIFFVSSSFVFTTHRLPCKLTFILKSAFFSWRRFCPPRGQKNDIYFTFISQCYIRNFGAKQHFSTNTIIFHPYKYVIECISKRGAQQVGVALFSEHWNDEINKPNDILVPP